MHYDSTVIGRVRSKVGHRIRNAPRQHGKVSNMANERKFRVVDYPLLSMLMVVIQTQKNIVANAPTKLTIVQWRILGALGEESWIAMTKLSDRTFVERTALHHSLNKMEERGYIKRRQGRSDKRSVEISLTPKGRRLYLKCSDVAQTEIEDALNGLSKRDLAQLSKTLDKIKLNLGVSDW